MACCGQAGEHACADSVHVREAVRYEDILATTIKQQLFRQHRAHLQQYRLLPHACSNASGSAERMCGIVGAHRSGRGMILRRRQWRAWWRQAQLLLLCRLP